MYVLQKIYDVFISSILQSAVVKVNSVLLLFNYIVTALIHHVNH